MAPMPSAIREVAVRVLLSELAPSPDVSSSDANVFFLNRLLMYKFE
jgi:hypothetical protein